MHNRTEEYQSCVVHFGGIHILHLGTKLAEYRKRKGVVTMSGVNKKNMIGIFAFCFTGMLANITMGILAYIMQGYPNVNPTTVSQILTTPALVGTGYAFCVGLLHKKIPAKYLMILSQGCLFAYGMIFLFLGGTAPIGVLIAAAGLLGIGQGSNNTLLAIALSEACPDENKRGGILGICMSVMNIGGVIFTNVGAALAVNRWQNAYMTFFVVAASLVLQFLFLPKGAFKAAPAPAAEQKKEKTALPAKVWLICINYFFFFLALYVYGTNVSEYIVTTYKLGTSIEAGLASSMVTVGGIFAGALFGVYSKWTKKLTVPVMMALASVGLSLCCFFPNIILVYCAGILGGFAMSGANPYIMSYMAQITTPDQYSSALSIFSGFMNGGMCVAITVLAFITKMICGDGAHVPTKFLVGLIMCVGCAVTAVPIYAGKDKK